MWITFACENSMTNVMKKDEQKAHPFESHVQGYVFALQPATKLHCIHNACNGNHVCSIPHGNCAFL